MENSSWGSLTNSREKELQVQTRLFCVLEGGMTDKNVFPASLSGVLNFELTSVRENTISCTSSPLSPTVSVVEEGTVFRVWCEWLQVDRIYLPQDSWTKSLYSSVLRNLQLEVPGEP